MPLSGFDWEINPPYPDVNVDVHQPNMALVAGPVAEGNVLQRALLVGPNLLCEVLLHARGRDGLRIVAINSILQPEHHAVVIFGRDWDILRPAPDRNGNGPNHLFVLLIFPRECVMVLPSKGTWIYITLRIPEGDGL